MIIDYNQINKKNLIIDIRPLFNFKNDNAFGFLNIPKNKLLSEPDKYIKKDKVYYLVCDKGIISLYASKILNALGYNTYSIKGGIEKIKECK